MALSDWRGPATFLNGFTGTLPALELKDVGWDEISGLLCPPEPASLTDKKTGQYVVPCLLKEAPLVEKTLEAAIRNGTSTIGKMRSKSHVTEAAFAMMDVDGLSEEDFLAALEKMKADGITVLDYTTHSYGDPDKPGIRARLAIPIDRAVGIEEYRAVWKGIDNRYFNGAAGRADSSGSNLYQQQGTWCSHPDRVDQAKSWRHDGGVASADFLIELGGGVEPPKPVNASSVKTLVSNNGTYLPSDANKIADKCQQIRLFRDNKGAGQSEPVWRDSLGVTIFCIDGVAFSQEWSSGYPGYDEAETAKKIASRINFPPTTCEQFRRTNPEGCKGCIQRCNSPISLGYGDLDGLAVLQQRFALLNLNGKIWLFDRTALSVRTSDGTAAKLNLSTRSDGGLLMERYFRSIFPNADAGKILKNFWVDPETACYDGVEFNPKGTSGNYLNLWIGPTITPIPGEWFLIKAFFLEVICDGDQEAHDYLVKYIAHALQHPEEKPGVMIILIGGQGTGKGTVGRILHRIWSATYIHTNNIDTVTGNFNVALERSFILFMDEALFAGDRKASDALKSNVTEEIIQINEKYQPARQVRTYHRFFAATNAAHFKNTERDDRRDFTLRVSESRKGDHAYWAALNHEILNGGVEAMAYDLLAMDLSGFNVRSKPNTKEFLEQKLLSLDHIPRWWHDCLDAGSVEDDGKWPGFIRTKDVIEKIVEFSGGKMHRLPSASTIVKEMKKLCPSARSEQKQIHGPRHRGLTLPPLKQARIEFEQYIGGAVSWPEEPETAQTAPIPTEDPCTAMPCPASDSEECTDITGIF